MGMKEIQKVQRARERQRTATEEYVAAVVAAHAAGESVSAIARAAGVSRQAIIKTLRRR